MTRPGGEADKLGNRYEGLWTVNVLLDVVEGLRSSLTVEPYDHESAGIEFVTTNENGATEAHSAKRRTATGSWTLARLSAQQNKRTGRSILGDLVANLDEVDRVVFVSGSEAKELEQISEVARGRVTAESFANWLEGQDKLSARFAQYVSPLFANDSERAYESLASIEVVVENENALRARVEERIRGLFRNHDSSRLDPTVVRLLLGDYVLDHLGVELTANATLASLEQHGISESRFEGSATIRRAIEACNGLYQAEIRNFLIFGHEIARSESTAAYDVLMGGKSVLIEGSAGDGKSCALSRTIQLLTDDDSPVLALRLDTLTSADVSAQLFGRNRGLPDSPVVTLGRFAGARSSVLCLDQVDALSSVSGRNEGMWRLLQEMLVEAAAFPNMRLLFGCRSFELDYDPRLKTLVNGTHCTRIELERLTVDQVRDAIPASQGGVLSESLLDLLRTPLHLYLYSQLPTPPQGLVTRADLFDAYWDAKRQAVDMRAGSPGTWQRAVDKICQALSDRHSLVVPTVSLDLLDVTLAAMRSEAVVSEEDGACRFFHESFFDYAFARSFLRQGRELVPWLEADAQLLFRRSQVRQVLNFLREQKADRDRYVVTLRSLLQSMQVHFHIKRLALDLLRTSANPFAEEWKVLDEFSPDLGSASWSVISNSVAWFDLLESLNWWAHLLSDPHDDVVNRAVTLLRMPTTSSQRSAVTARLLSPFVGRNEDWNSRLRFVMSTIDASRSDEMEQLLLAVIADGTMDDARGFASNSDWWSMFYSESTSAPEFMCRVLAAWWDRQITRARETGRENPFEGQPEIVPSSQSSEHVIESAASGAPTLFAREMLPRVLRLEQQAPTGVSLGGMFGNPDDQIREGLERALARLAVSDTTALDVLVGPHLPTESRWFASALLRAWTANPAVYANRIIEFLVAAPERLRLGHSISFGGEDQTAGIARRAIAAATALCTQEALDALERVLSNMAVPGEQQHSEWIGFTELLLLRAIQSKRLSASQEGRMADLAAKFPDAPTVPSPSIPSFDRILRPVGPPLASDAIDLLSDDDWLATMRDIAVDRPASDGDGFTGGAYQLAPELSRKVKEDPARFAALAQRMTSEINSTYFDAILDALSPSANNEDLRGTPSDVFAVIRHVAATKPVECDRAIVRAVRALVNEPLPDDIVLIVVQIAASTDPEADDWFDETGWHDPISQAINSSRGEAARTLAQILFQDRGRWQAIRECVERLCEDPVLAVRAVAVDCLLAILDSNRDDSLQLFERLLRGAEAIVGADSIERYLRYALFRDYARVKPVIEAMANSNDPAVAQSAGRLLAQARLWVDGAAIDLDTAMHGSEAIRTGVAEVAAAAITDADAGEMCEELLLKFFNDSESIRKEASDCWRHMKSEDVVRHRGLLSAFAKSPAFADSGHLVFYRLKDLAEPLPQEVIELAKRAITEYGEKAGAIQFAESAHGSDIAELVLRMYRETSDPAVQEQLLEVLDEMLRLGFMGLGDGLGAFDR